MRVALLFPGQGSQYVGMGKEIYEKYEVAKKTFEEASDILGFDLCKMCFEGNLEELTRTSNAQPAILTTSVAAFRVLERECNGKTIVSAGHSLGEISALTCAGALDFESALKLVVTRGKLMEESSQLQTGSMIAVRGVPVDSIERMCESYSVDKNSIVAVSNYNSNNQIVISGHTPIVQSLSEELEEVGANIKKLNVSAAFHSPLMESAAIKFREELLGYNYNSLKWKVISNVTGKAYSSSDEIVDLLYRQIVEPVKWSQSMNQLKNYMVDMCIELGPKTVLRDLMKGNDVCIDTYSFDNTADREKIYGKMNASVADNCEKKEFKHTILTKCLAIAVCTKNSNWNNDEYEKGVIEPYRKIKQMQEELEKRGALPTIDQMREALLMLQSVFHTKKTPVKEQRERFDQIFSETGTEELFPDFKELSNS